MWIIAVIIAAVVLWLILRTAGKRSKAAKRDDPAPSPRATPRPLTDVPAVRASSRRHSPPETASMK